MDKLRSLSQWLGYLERIHPSEIDLGLQRVAEVATRLALDKPAATIITVAGTNGKGSCVCAMETMLLSQNLSAGAFTSPHLIDFNERIRVNGANAADSEICQAFAAIDAARDNISLTYFEFATLAAFYIFQHRALDYWLLEVGLGGRLDAVNILDADLAVITSIDLDHQHWLGNTREVIAREKAGVLRKNIPCVVAEPDMPASLISVIEALQCDFYKYGSEFYLSTEGQLKISASNRRDAFFVESVLPLLPKHSVAAACQALALLNKLPQVESLKALLNSLSLSGRFQVETWGDYTVVLDVAHNPAATQLLAEKLQHLALENETYFVTAVIAMMQDKAIEQSLQPLTKLVNHWLLADLPSKRAASSSTIAEALVAVKVAPSDIQYAKSVEQALLCLTNNDKPGRDGRVDAKIIVVAGSFLTVAEGLAYLRRQRHSSVVSQTNVTYRRDAFLK